MITSTIGRPELEDAIISVQNQTYPAKHYIFVDGEAFKPSAEKILSKYPNVVPIYLPMNTGKDGWFNSRINSIAPFLVEEEIICFLDDDNFYEPNHIATIAETFQRTSADWVYSLRNFVKTDGSFLCQDVTESIGFYQYEPPPFSFVEAGGVRIHLNLHSEMQMIDVNAYALRNDLAKELVLSWNVQGYGNDRVIFNHLKSLSERKYACTDCFTVNYRINPKTHGQGKDWNAFIPVFVDEAIVEEVIYRTYQAWMNHSKMIKI